MHLVYGGVLVSVVYAVRWDYQIEVLYLDRVFSYWQCQ